MLFVSLFLSLFLAHAEIPKPVELEHPGNQMNPLKFEKVTIKSLGRTSYLYLPDRPEGEKSPLLVFGHGQALGEDSYNMTLAHLAEKGIAALHVQYDRNFFDRDWRRMASDWNKISMEVLADHAEKIDENMIIYSGHSKGAYVGLVAAGAPNKPKLGALLMFAPAGYDKEYLNNIDPKVPVSLFWGEKDGIIEKSLVMEIHDKLKVERKQYVELVSYSDREADHFFILNKRSAFGGQNGISAFHYHGVWKWLVGAAWDLETGAAAENPYIYGEKAGTTGDPAFEHKILRNWE